MGQGFLHFYTHSSSLRDYGGYCGESPLSVFTKEVRVASSSFYTSAAAAGNSAPQLPRPLFPENKSLGLFLSRVASSGALGISPQACN